MTRIDIVISTDDRSAPFAAAVLRSVVTSAEPDDNIHAHVLTLGLSSINVHRFTILSDHLGIPIDVIRVDADIVGELPEFGFTRSAYLRIFSAELLPELSNAIYLDTDILVRGSLSSIYNLVGSDFVLAAARDATSITEWPGLRSEVPPDFEIREYFNSGVMFMNLEFFRKNDMSGLVHDIIVKNHGSILVDQSALNIGFSGKVIFLPIKYNYIVGTYDRIVYLGTPDSAEVSKYYSEPLIVHFAGYQKPWKKAFPQRFAAEFRRHIISTPWGADAIPSMTARDHIARAVRLIRLYALKSRYLVRNSFA